MKKIAGIKVRKASMEDIKELLVMGHEFFKETMDERSDSYDARFVAEQATHLINTDGMEILVAENGGSLVGCLALMEVPAYYNKDIKVVADHHFWINKGYRNSSVTKTMLQAARNWAANRGLRWFRAKIAQGKHYRVQRIRS